MGFSCVDLWIIIILIKTVLDMNKDSIGIHQKLIFNPSWVLLPSLLTRGSQICIEILAPLIYVDLLSPLLLRNTPL